MDWLYWLCEGLYTSAWHWDRDQRDEETPWQTWVVGLIWIVFLALVVLLCVWLLV